MQFPWGCMFKRLIYAFGKEGFLRFRCAFLFLESGSYLTFCSFRFTSKWSHYPVETLGWILRCCDGGYLLRSCWDILQSPVGFVETKMGRVLKRGGLCPSRSGQFNPARLLYLMKTMTSYVSFLHRGILICDAFWHRIPFLNQDSSVAAVQIHNTKATAAWISFPSNMRQEREVWTGRKCR